jgi:hypothetical protein
MGKAEVYGGQDMEEKNRAINWLNDAVRYFQQEQKQAATRWIAEQHQEREKACKYALRQIETA